MNLSTKPALKSDLKINTNASLYIIQSNTFSISSSQLPLYGDKMREILEENKLIIHADPKFGPSVGYIDGNKFLANTRSILGVDVITLCINSDKHKNRIIK